MESNFGKPKREPKLDGAKRLVSSWAVLWNDGTVSFGDPRMAAVKREKTLRSWISSTPADRTAASAGSRAKEP